MKFRLPGLGGGNATVPSTWSINHEAQRAKAFRFTHSPDGLWLGMTIDVSDGQITRSITMSVAVAELEAFEKELTRELEAMSTILNQRSDEMDAAVKLITGK